MRGVAALIALCALVTACQAPDDTTPPERSPLVAACAGDQPTGPQTIAGADLARFIATTPLPADVRVAGGQLAFSPQRAGLVDLSLDLCLPGEADLDDLRLVATALAHDLAAHELGDRTAALSVACVCPHDPGVTAVRDPAFQQHPWDGTPSPEAELLTWEIVTG
ncbi:hypothetical protein [Nocardia sp. AG03]|uniref:hypothetical protein n=1 Tax=Nocardia sp. AG03 TaxID=3025312 RepID=UPI00241878F7|nr:hypothetical protein [Nocardia sp. AG03]